MYGYNKGREYEVGAKLAADVSHMTPVGGWASEDMIAQSVLSRFNDRLHKVLTLVGEADVTLGELQGRLFGSVPEAVQSGGAHGVNTAPVGQLSVLEDLLGEAERRAARALDRAGTLARML